MGTKQGPVMNKNLGNKNCRHPTLITEYAYGSPTGNYICTQCERLLPANLQRVKSLNTFWAKTAEELVLS
jgi:hypothetical protein